VAGADGAPTATEPRPRLQSERMAY
jgi:hypothetical protein